MAEENEQKQPDTKPMPKPQPGKRSGQGLPTNPRDMTPGRSGAYETR
jgi:hypothetical protein